MQDAPTRDNGGAIDWWTEHLAELWEKVREHESACTCWHCRNWRASTEP
jgi:hypothetical protein